jgi:hypothetical protein
MLFEQCTFYTFKQGVLRFTPPVLSTHFSRVSQISHRVLYTFLQGVPSFTPDTFYTLTAGCPKLHSYTSYTFSVG